MENCRQSEAQRRSELRNEMRLEADEFFQRHRPSGHRRNSMSDGPPDRHHWHYQRLQFRRMYRYGLSLLLVGALCNWIGFAQHYFTPVRYLGVGCVVAGALCICIALCRWLTLRSSEPNRSNHEVASCGGGTTSIHVIAVPIQSVDHPFHPQSHHQTGSMMIAKPPDYETAIGSKPPSYDEAVRINPAILLASHCPSSSTETESGSTTLDPAAFPNHQLPDRPPNCSIDCSRCGGIA